ncbi:MAG: peptide chain release factor N(5)-glutamine methyltransferase [Planctomycetes bacterium]|nr:peptide chain release factor N(5)-glutamine methyltransferase [Planctomycetota bacterium]
MSNLPRRPQSLQEELRAASRFLATAGSEDARLEAEMLAAHILGVERMELLLRDESLSESQRATLEGLLQRRAVGEPVAYLEGSRGFWGLEFLVDPRVLIPRPDSELLIVAALEIAVTEMGTVSDWGTGSGALLLSFLHERPGWRGIAVDQSTDALAVARANIVALGLQGRARCLESDWGEQIDDASLDLILCNPPYIEPSEELGPGVAEYEPHEALFVEPGKPYAHYEQVLADAARVLRPGGSIVFEVGRARIDGVIRRAREAGWAVVDQRRDLGGVWRCLALQRGDL